MNYSTTSTNQNNIIPKDCSYQCGTRIYWNTTENSYFEVFTKKKHVCPSRSNNNSSSVNRPFYSKKPWAPKPKMSNSLELLQGPIADIQKKYEILSDIITEVGGKTHGSQSHIFGPPSNSIISLVVYYEVPTEGKREEVKQRFNNFARTSIVLQKY